MAKLKITGDPSYRDQHGYTRVGGILKSDDEKAALQKRQDRLNKYTPEQNKEVANQMKVNTSTPKRNDINYDLENGEGGGLPKGDEASEKKRKFVIRKRDQRNNPEKPKF